MRSYSGLLVFESVFDMIPPQEDLLTRFSSSLFSPSMPIIEADCGTLLGKKTLIDYPIEGRVELATGLRITQDRVKTLLSNGVYYTYLRTLDTCVSPGGVCQACYSASRPDKVIPAVGLTLAVEPEYILYAETLYFKAGDFTQSLSVSPSQYDKTLVFHDGQLVTSGYTIESFEDESFGTLTLDIAVTEDSYFTVHYVSVIRSPYMYWLASTYSGSLLGMNALPAPSPHLRPALVTELISDGYLEEVIDNVRAVGRAPSDLIEYLSDIPGKLEKSLFALALGVIYSQYS